MTDRTPLTTGEGNTWVSAADAARGSSGRTGKLGIPLRLSTDTRPQMIRNRNGSPVAEAVNVDVALALIEYANHRDYLLAECERLRERLADTETEKIERGTEILRLREELRIREESQIPVIPRAAKERLDAAEAECEHLREERDAARQALNEIDWNPGGARRIARAALGEADND